MLTLLQIKNFAIIDELFIEFGEGLNVMTGETGAGKTIIVEAFRQILGAKSGADCVRSGQDKAHVTAIFDAKKMPAALKKIIQDAEIDFDDEIIINRSITMDGKSRVTVNGVAATVSLLKTIAAHIVDVSSQHEHQLLLEPSEHGRIVDIFGGLEKESITFSNVHSKWLQVAKEVEMLKENERGAKERLDFLKFQLSELSAANLNPGEDVHLEEQKKRLKYANTLEEKARSSWSSLYGDESSALGAIDRACTCISQCLAYDSKLSPVKDSLERARGEVEEVARELAHYAEGLDSNPALLEELDERLHLIRSLMKKHGGSIESCIAKKETLVNEVAQVENFDEILKEKLGNLDSLSKERRFAAKVWSEGRKKAGAKLSSIVEDELASLGMSKTKFSLKMERREEEFWDENGPDKIEFLMSPNVGEELRSLSKIASGGELSRVMLAIKSAMSVKGGFVATSIFDEVDSGIGGAIAEVVGRKLKNVASERQVICITHLPQVAAFADKHFKISKRVEKGRTIAAIESITGEHRVDEISRMLGGQTITDVAKKHAKEMLKMAK